MTEPSLQHWTSGGHEKPVSRGRLSFAQQRLEIHDRKLPQIFLSAKIVGPLENLEGIYSDAVEELVGRTPDRGQLEENCEKISVSARRTIKEV